MSDDSLQDSLGEDGLFKLLTWRSPAISRIFGLPDIVGEPRQQEFSHPAQRRVDRLYDLEDGSLLNVEHQSSLNDREALARRLIEYRLMIRDKIPFPRVIRQAVVFIGAKPRDRTLVKDIAYQDVDEFGGGLTYHVVVKDFLAVPVSVFRASGEPDDLILGVLASGARDRDYMSEVMKRVDALRGEEGKTARAKFVAACVIRSGEPVIRELEDVGMWIDDIEDNPLAQKFVKVVGKKLMAEESRKTLARLLVAHAKKLNLNPPPDAETLLMSCSEEALFEMANDLEHMTDFAGFVRSHGIEALAGAR